jgi:hypothetical protein
LEFDVGDWVWLRLLHWTTQSLEPQAKGKLGPRYTGLFKCWSALVGLPTGCTFWKALTCMMSSTWACSSATRVTLLPHRLLFHRCWMAGSFLLPSPPTPFARRGSAHVLTGHSASSIVLAFFTPLVLCRTVGFGSNAALMGAACHTRPAG